MDAILHRVAKSHIRPTVYLPTYLSTDGKTNLMLACHTGLDVLVGMLLKGPPTCLTLFIMAAEG